ncbi:MAG: hypothetical protein HZA31_12265 [Opitutae bacterium]|nr:hypothetical protein [Opitutae bacterium]
MRIRSLLACLAFAGLPLAVTAQADASDDAESLIGQIDGQTYISPTGLFRVTIPVLPELGANITDTPRVVTFEDAFTMHITVAAFPMDATQRWELSTRGKKDYLVYFFTNFVLADFVRKFPGSAVESAKFLSTVQEGSLLAYTLLPGGSMFRERVALFGERDNLAKAKRGNLVFIRNDHVFIISSELGERATERSQYTKKTAEEDAILQPRLMDMLGRMTFTGAAKK